MGERQAKDAPVLFVAFAAQEFPAFELRHQHRDVRPPDQEPARKLVVGDTGVPVEVHQHVELRRLQVERLQRGSEGASDRMTSARHGDPVTEARIDPGQLRNRVHS